MSSSTAPNIPYPSIVAESLTFSPNGRRLAYGAAVDTQTFVVVDGQEGPRYDALVPDRCASA